MHRTALRRPALARTVASAAASLAALALVAAGPTASASPALSPLGADTTPPATDNLPVQPLFVSDWGGQIWSPRFTDDVGVASADVRFRGAGPTATALGAWVYPKYMQDLPWQEMPVQLTSPRAARTSCISVRARDAAGNVSAWSTTRCATQVVDDGDLLADTRWTAGFGTLQRFDRGTFSRSTRKGAELLGPLVRARHVGVLVTTCPTCGSLDLFIGSHLVATLSTRAAHGHYRVMLVARVKGGPAYGRLRAVVHSSGAPVIVDGLGATIV